MPEALHVGHGDNPYALPMIIKENSWNPYYSIRLAGYARDLSTALKLKKEHNLPLSNVMEAYTAGIRGEIGRNPEKAKGGAA